MNTLLLVFVIAVSAASASIYGPAAIIGHAGLGATVKGPAVGATIVGPDGSSIAASADAGAVVSAPTHGGVISAGVAPGVVVSHGIIGHGPARLIAPGIHGWGVPIWILSECYRWFQRATSEIVHLATLDAKTDRTGLIEAGCTCIHNSLRTIAFSCLVVCANALPSGHLGYGYHGHHALVGASGVVSAHGAAGPAGIVTGHGAIGPHGIHSAVGHVAHVGAVGHVLAHGHDDGQWHGEGLLESQDWAGHHGLHGVVVGHAGLAHAHGLAYAHGYGHALHHGAVVAGPAGAIVAHAHPGAIIGHHHGHW
ncbi:hypothetical protein FQA39_LY10257 [Lamprigera yunnana]|nr:hypothetical protein FQA39_LY10257 [Lamprigera yunnana]